MNALLSRLLVVMVILGALPSLAAAQSLAGTVRDTSGAVLPGVTIEASSPALITKVRTSVTDDAGQYRIPDLPPGTYKVTFTLPGFATVVREGLELSGGGVMTIGAEMRVGSLEESITVTGESPVVDIQTARQQKVINGDIVRALPASRSYGNYIAAIPAIQATGFGERRVDHQQLLLGARRAEHRRPHPARWDERGRARQRWRRVRIPVRHVELLGSAGGHFRRPRRGRPRRPGLQHHPEDRRQHVQRDRLYQLRGQVGTVEQHRRPPALAGTSASSRRSSRATTPTSPWADRFCATACGSSATRAPSAPTRSSRTCTTTRTRETRTPGRGCKATALSVRNSTSKTLNAVRLTWQATQKNKFGFYIDYTKNCSGGAYKKAAISAVIPVTAGWRLVLA